MVCGCRDVELPGIMVFTICQRSCLFSSGDKTDQQDSSDHGMLLRSWLREGALVLSTEDILSVWSHLLAIRWGAIATLRDIRFGPVRHTLCTSPRSTHR